MIGEFEGFSVNGKTPEAGDGFSDSNKLGATDIDPVGEVEGIRVRALLGASVYGWVGCPDPYAEASTQGIDVDEGDGFVMTTDDANIVGNSVGDSEDEHQGTVV